MAEFLAEIFVRLLVVGILFPCIFLIATPIVWMVAARHPGSYWIGLTEGYRVAFDVWVSIAEQVAVQ